MKKLLDLLLSRWYVPRHQLQAAYNLIIMHHDVSLRDKLRLGQDCPVCVPNHRFHLIQEILYP
jgi:hypothetical protein